MEGKQRIAIDSIKDHIIIDLIKERKSERVWRWIRRGGIIAGVLFAFVMSLSNYISANGLPSSDKKIAVVSIHGEIGEGNVASAIRVIPSLRKAFKDESVKTVVLDIDSPGGQPQEAERIYGELKRLKAKYKKPVVAVISAQGASAAYLIAIHADKIMAGHYSMVGSIGAIIQTWDFSQAAGKIGIGRTTVASGAYKDLLNPFRQMTKEDEVKVRELVGSMANHFIAEVIERRGKITNFQERDIDIFTGEVWSGDNALKLGLIDGIDTLEGFTEASGLRIKDYGPEKPTGKGLFSKLGFDSAVDVVMSRLTKLASVDGVTLK